MTLGYFSSKDQLDSFIDDTNAVKRLEYRSEEMPTETPSADAKDSNCPYLIIFGGMDFSSMFNETLFLTL